eukprot:m.8580 g.8580  ORF g.8580 m.8580 type:complete len:482 (+) comp5372_c0_seq2:156-1601(+)
MKKLFKRSQGNTMCATEEAVAIQAATAGTTLGAHGVEAALKAMEERLVAEIRSVSISQPSTSISRLPSSPPPPPSMSTGSVAATTSHSYTAVTEAMEPPTELKIPGGVFISFNVRTTKSEAELLKAALEGYGVRVWVCTEFAGGSDFRDEIVRGIKESTVFVPLINDAWASSGECKDEFSLAKRRHLTSHESGRTKPEDYRLPGIVPVGFPDLVWDKYAHVELLAANTNFVVHGGGNFNDTVVAILQALVPYSQEEKGDAASDGMDGKDAVGDSGGKRDKAGKAVAKGSDQPDNPPQNKNVSHKREVDVRKYDMRSTHLRPRYLGTSSYENEESFSRHRLLVVSTETMELEFTRITNDPKKPYLQRLVATAQYATIGNRYFIDGKQKTYAELLEEFGEAMAEFLAPFPPEEKGEPYGAEEFKGKFYQQSGTLELTSVKSDSSVDPTWHKLTVCDDGNMLIGVAGSVKGSSKTLDATRLIAF